MRFSAWSLVASVLLCHWWLAVSFGSKVILDSWRWGSRISTSEAKWYDALWICRVMWKHLNNTDEWERESRHWNFSTTHPKNPEVLLFHRTWLTQNLFKPSPARDRSWDESFNRTWLACRLLRRQEIWSVFVSRPAPFNLGRWLFLPWTLWAGLDVFRGLCSSSMSLNFYFLRAALMISPKSGGNIARVQGYLVNWSWRYYLDTTHLGVGT